MSHISIDPAKYVDNCVDDSLARRYFARASASSWKPPSTIKPTASSSVMGLIGFVINAVLLLATAFVSKAVGFTLQVGDYPPSLTADTLIAAIVGAVVLSLISTVIRLVVRD